MNTIFNLRFLLLLIIPICTLLVIKCSNQEKFWEGKYDPDYCYLLNGLNVANQYGNIGHIDHPGTTVQVLSAIIIKTTYKFRETKNDLITDVLLFPEFYLKIIAWIFLIINCFIIFFSGLIMYKLTDEISYGLLFESVVFFSVSTINHQLYRVTPESVLFGSVIVFLTVFLVIFYFKKSFRRFNQKYFIENCKDISSGYWLPIILLGVIMGFCFATKINSVTLIILPLIFVPNKKKIIFLFITFLFFLIFTLPIYHHYKRFLFWIINLFTHSGKHGIGENKIIDFNQFIDNFITFIKFEPVLLFTIVISFVIIIKQIIKKNHDIHLKFLIGLFIVQVFTLMLVLKHFSLRYFIPIYPTIPVSIFMILQISGFSKKKRLFVIIPFIVASFLLTFSFKKNGSNVVQTIKQVECINLYAYGSDSPIYALKFGNGYSNYAFSSYLEKLYGKQYFYNIWSKQFYVWHKPIKIDTLLKMNKPIYLYANNDSIATYYSPVFKFKLISPGKYLVKHKPLDSLEFR